MKILIIPDAHCTPGVDNDRFLWAGKYIVEKQPDVIVCLGDFFDMHSYNQYDKPGSKSLEGTRHKSDFTVGIEAQQALFHSLHQYNKGLKKKYKPRLVFLLGNHENRISRFLEQHPQFEGQIGLDDLQLQSFGWEVHPFLDIVEIEGIHFSHYFTNGVMGTPIGGDYAPKRIIQVLRGSGVAGHSHLLQVHTDTTRTGKRHWGLVAGCYFDHDVQYVDRATQHLYWRGLTMLHDVHDGDYDPMFISMKYLREKYQK